MLIVDRLTEENITGALNRITIARLSCHTLLSGTLTSRTWKDPPPPPPLPPPPHPKSRRAAPRDNRMREAGSLEWDMNCTAGDSGRRGTRAEFEGASQRARRDRGSPSRAPDGITA
jgi:hypothetical protein